LFSIVSQAEEWRLTFALKKESGVPSTLSEGDIRVLGTLLTIVTYYLNLEKTEGRGTTVLRTRKIEETAKHTPKETEGLGLQCCNLTQLFRKEL
jgi:hypothetical protein